MHKTFLSLAGVFTLLLAMLSVAQAGTIKIDESASYSSVGVYIDGEQVAALDDDGDTVISAVAKGNRKITIKGITADGEWSVFAEKTIFVGANTQSKVNFEITKKATQQRTARLKKAKQAKLALQKKGVVKISKTGLMWKRCSEGQRWTGSTCRGSVSKFNWQQAKDRANSHVYADYSDWRLPTIKELNSLVYCSNGKQIKYKKDGYDSIQTEGGWGCESDSKGSYKRPTINQQLFPNTASEFYSSSSPFAGNSYGAWGVFFNHGFDMNFNRVNYFHVRLVRSGQ